MTTIRVPCSRILATGAMVIATLYEKCDAHPFAIRYITWNDFIMSHVLDVPFYNSLFDSISQNNGRVTMGLLLRIIGNARNYQFQTFSNTLVNGELNKNALDLQEEKEQKWSKAEIQAKDDCISVVGYDPFDG